MRMLKRSLLLSLPLLAIYSWQAWGHHAFSAEFDKEAPVTLENRNKRPCGRLPSAAWPREYGSANGTCKALLVGARIIQNHQGIAEQWLPRT